MRNLVMPAALLLLGAVAAQAQPPAAPRNEQLRTFSLVNRAHQAVTAAHLTMSDGQDKDVVGNTPIQPEESRQALVGRQECLKSVAVTLKNGHGYRLDLPNDCHVAQILVFDNGLGQHSGAGPDHATIKTD